MYNWMILNIDRLLIPILEHKTLACVDHLLEECNYEDRKTAKEAYQYLKKAIAIRDPQLAEALLGHISG